MFRSRRVKSSDKSAVLPFPSPSSPRASIFSGLSYLLIPCPIGVCLREASYSRSARSERSLGAAAYSYRLSGIPKVNSSLITGRMKRSEGSLAKLAAINLVYLQSFIRRWPLIARSYCSRHLLYARHDYTRRFAHGSLRAPGDDCLLTFTNVSLERPMRIVIGQPARD